jgi:hypothetical protein
MIKQIEELPEEKIPVLTDEDREWLDADLCSGDNESE